MQGIAEAELDEAVERGRELALTEFRAISTRYLEERDLIEIVTTRQGGFLVPRHMIEAFRELTASDLAHLTVWPDGSAIEIETRDIQISVHGLLTSALSALLPAGLSLRPDVRRRGESNGDEKLPHVKQKKSTRKDDSQA